MAETMDMMNAAIIADFLERVKNKNLSLNTYVNYEIALRQLYDFAKEENEYIADMTPFNINKLINTKYTEYAPTTVSARLSTFSMLYEHLIIENKSSTNPILKSLYPKKTKRKFTAFNKADYENFLKYLENTSSIDFVLSAILMRESGLRVSEPNSIDFKKDYIDVQGEKYINLIGKGAKQRTVPVYSTKAQKIIENLIENHKNRSEIYISITQQTMQYHINNWEKKEKKTEHHVTHDLRRGFAQSAMQTYHDIETVRYLMGHNSYNTTLIYLYNNDNLIYNLNKKLII